MKDLIICVLFTIAIILIGYPLVYWILNPELTEMQMLIRYWLNYLVAVAIIASLSVVDKLEY